MKYFSTRDAQKKSGVSLSTAIVMGAAADGGLFMPETLPDLSGVAAAADPVLAAIAPFFEGDALEASIPAIIADALSISSPVVPIANVDNAWRMELFHGPTAAFKDFGARFMAAANTHIKRDDARDLTILVATSGDTGGAVAAAFHNRPGVRVVILYPDGRVSPLQAHQLSCWGGNISTLRVQGTFDDCQAMVKAAFADAPLRAALNLTSANSINIGRLLPQMTYYVRAATAHLTKTGGKPGFIVPTGNVGNVFAAILARACGAPIGKISVATNANDVIPEYLRTGAVPVRDASVSTYANAMDVAVPSNLERLRALYPDVNDMRAQISAYSVGNDDILAEMQRFYGDSGVIICPHTACGTHVLRALRASGDDTPYIVAETAHAAKFQDVVTRALGPDVQAVMPPALAALMSLPAVAKDIGNTYADLKAALSAGV